MYELIPFSYEDQKNIIDQFFVSIEIREKLIILDYLIEGNIEHISIYGNSEKNDHQLYQREDNLWSSTCFEAFIRYENQESPYWELNLSPQLKWNFYSFKNYRLGMRPVLNEGEKIRMNLDKSRKNLIFHAEFYWNKLPSLGPILILPCAVIKNKKGELSYWAIEHLNQQGPDFHLF